MRHRRRRPARTRRRRHALRGARGGHERNRLAPPQERHHLGAKRRVRGVVHRMPGAAQGAEVPGRIRGDAGE